ncbi:MAG: hypothetical protein ACTSQA_00970 [Candidatus Heimdallarchaeaceae archaeon]
MEQDQFIDDDSNFRGEKDSYEGILLKQMQKCVEILTKDRQSCLSSRRTNRGTETSENIDLDELIINAVDTFKMLMFPFTKGSYQEDIKEILKGLKEEIDNIGDKETMIPGVGKVKIKDAILPEGSIFMEMIKRERSKAYRRIFGILVEAYHKNKGDIAKFSSE